MSYIYKIWPIRQQWKNWKLPSKLTAIGTLLTLISLVITILFFLFGIFIDIKTNNKNVHKVIDTVTETDKNSESLEDYISKADNLFYLGNYYKALEYYEKAITIDPHDSDIWRKKGITYVSFGMKSKNFKFCIDNCRSVNNRKLFKKALFSLDRALKENPEDKEVYIFNGLVRYCLGNNSHPQFGPSKHNTQNAWSMFKTANSLEPDLSRVNGTKWTYETSCAYYGMSLIMEGIWRDMGGGEIGYGYKEDADKYFQKAKECSPSCIPHQ